MKIHEKRIGWMMLTLLFLALTGCAGMEATSGPAATPRSAEETTAKTEPPGPPTDPILRVETGMHTAIIRRISVDREERFLVTGSADKTVRVWDLETGALQKVLRVPMDRGRDGSIFAAAISPDGRTVAAGGWSQVNNNDIYLFDRASGALTARISGLPNVIIHLAFSPDGRHLAATLGGKDGLRVYRTADWNLAAEDADYGARSNWTAFDRAGRLVTVCYDGFIRLYDRNFNRTGQAKAPGGDRPFSAAFSPDGKRIAVGYADSTRVDVLSGDDLSGLYAPDTSGVDNTLNSVAWSAEGRFLLAAGTHDARPGMTLIRRWAESGRGMYRDLTGSTDTIMHIFPLSDGRTVFGSADPAWGILDRRGERVRFLGPAIPDLRGPNEDEFQISNDGQKVFFGFEYGGDRPAVFSIADRNLSLDGDASALQPPLTRAEALSVASWKHTRSPKLNGASLDLEQYEWSRSLAIAPDGESFLLGTEWYVRRFDKDGDLLWKTSVGGAAWGVNISGDGQTAVAALADGTIRWYRMKDGKELLALFPHKDGKRWVLWTPQGYYDASEGGDELIGWHINRGRDRTPEFIDNKQLSEIFYRPDLVSSALTRGGPMPGVPDVAEVLREGLPPKVEILSPQDNQQVSGETVAVRYRVFDQGRGVGPIRVFLNGAAVKRGGERGIVRKQGGGKADVREIEVDLVPGAENQIGVVAYDSKAELRSDEATVLVVSQARIRKPGFYALAVGIDSFANPDINLRYARSDAEAVADALRRSVPDALFDGKEIRTLVDEEATLDRIRAELDRLKTRTSAEDVVMIYMATHGTMREEKYYMLTADTGYLTTEDLAGTSLTGQDLRDVMGEIPASKKLLVLDTCKAGKVAMDLTRSISESTTLELLSRAVGSYIIAASTETQFANEGYRNHGLFTYVLLEGLEGAADLDHNGLVEVDELKLHVKRQVPELAHQVFGRRQFPTASGMGQSFPLVRLR